MLTNPIWHGAISNSIPRVVLHLRPHLRDMNSFALLLAV